jgi:hypothetical protein
MITVRFVALALLVMAARFPASGQSVVSTHSGVVYFFVGSVFVGNERLEQKFGRFPDIGEGGELRTEQGRAEVLLTPGVVLRVAENSSIRMLSNKLSDTRVELLSGSAIVESNDVRKDTSVTLIYKKWQVRVPQESVYRIDASPAQLKAYKGEAEVSTDGEKPVKVKEGDVLPLAAVLLTDRAIAAEGDSFKSWAMNRSQAVAADNATAAQIIDDPSQFDTGGGLAVAGYSYFPPTGMSSLGINNPYGVSFWSSYQSMLNSIYFPPYLAYGAWPIRTGWPISTVGGGAAGYLGGSSWPSRPGLHASPLHQGPIVVPLRPGAYVQPGGTGPMRMPYPTQPRSYTYGPAPAPVPHGAPSPVGVHSPAHR